MWQINEVFEDYDHPVGKGWLYLNADKPMNPYHITYPVTWSGTIAQKEVKIVQRGNFVFSLDDLEFEIFPEKYEYVKGRIVEWIDDYLRVLD